MAEEHLNQIIVATTCMIQEKPKEQHNLRDRLYYIINGIVRLFFTVILIKQIVLQQMDDVHITVLNHSNIYNSTLLNSAAECD